MAVIKELLLEIDGGADVPTDSVGSPRVFVFETLMNEDLRNKILNREVPFTVDFIPNWKEITTNTEGGDDYHTIVPSEGSRVMGHCLDVTNEEVALFDKWEDQYERKSVILGSGITSYVYVLKKEYMRDYGKNTFYDLNPDDIAIMAKEFGDTVG